ncbi:DUF5103 domain-containing protein [Aquimarina sp. W85]|uniref:type IX secretion system plug protein n=1 Tax=Aquimarina rhodophyticola TaxID=3342246 RepID=UPI00366D476E
MSYSFFRHLIIIVFIIASNLQNISAQLTKSETYTAPYIKSIQFSRAPDETGIPILKIGEPIRMSFDDINGDETDYYYKIVHCDFDWSPSQLSKNEYLDGFDDIRITTYENSFNTLQMYSHYTLTIPNEDTYSLKVSGNYKIEIYNDDNELIFFRKLIVYENNASIKVEIKRSRDLKYINTKQSVHFEIDPKNSFFRNPDHTVKTLIIQNGDLQNSITTLKPQYNLSNKLVYRYDQESSFWGGNEFLFYDNKEIRSATSNIKRISLEDDLYHHYLYTNIVRSNRNYTYNPDINGGFIIRNLRSENSNTGADYVWMHFALQCYEPIGKGELYLYGDFNNYEINTSNKLIYNKDSGLFELKIRLKQGFYNYKYVLRNENGIIDLGFISGNFDETENNYTVLAYYRAPGARYDRVVGKGQANATTIQN